MKHLVKNYYDNRFSDDMDMLFRKWWINDEGREEKDLIMQNIWDTDLSLPDDSTLIDLEMKKNTTSSNLVNH